MRISWCFRASITDNETIDQQADRLFGKLIDNCVIYAFQAEVAPTTGYRHFQGYFELNNKKQFTWIQKHIQKFEYLSERKGTPRQAWTYATKQETRIAGPWMLGEPTTAESGPAKQLEKFVRSIEKGANDEELWYEYPSCMTRYPNIPAKRRLKMRPVREKDLRVIVLYGPPGTGKSRTALELYPEIYRVPYSKTGLWMTEDASDVKEVLIEDFQGDLPLKYFNRIIDRYPEKVEIKGGHLWWCPDVIVITTNVLPNQWYPQDKRQDVLGQIYRRITECYDFTGVEMDKRHEMQPISVHELMNRYATADEAPMRRGNAKQQFYQMMIEQMQRNVTTNPMMGLVREVSRPTTPTTPGASQGQKSSGKITKPPPYRWDPMTRKIQPARGDMEMPIQVERYDGGNKTQSPPAVSMIYRGLAHRPTMTEQMLMDGYSRDEEEQQEAEVARKMANLKKALEKGRIVSDVRTVEEMEEKRREEEEETARRHALDQQREREEYWEELQRMEMEEYGNEDDQFDF